MTRDELLAQQARTMTESQLESAVARIARDFSWLRYHTHRSDRSPAGFPDDVLVKAGRLIFAELKTERGRVSAEQTRWLEELGLVAQPIPDPAGFEDPEPSPVEVYLWRPMDLLNGTITGILSR